MYVVRRRSRLLLPILVLCIKIALVCLAIKFYLHRFLQNMVNLLEPIENVTRHLCGAIYPTLNLVHPYMVLLKKKFAPNSEGNETVNTYLDLIYGENYEENDENEIDDDIPAAGTRQQWQYAHRQFRQRMRVTQRQNRGREQENQTQFNNTDTNQVEYLPPVDTNGLLIKVRAAIYLSMEELWAVPTDISLVATFLDPRFKHFNWSTRDERNKAQSLVKRLYEELKINLTIPDDIEDRDRENDGDGDFFHELEGNYSTQMNTEEDDEVIRYARLKDVRTKDDPLEWWLKNKSSFPVLAQLARKYLSTPATSVPSERLFSDAGNHISAKRTRLSPDLVNRILFLKRNSTHFDMFPPLEN